MLRVTNLQAYYGKSHVLHGVDLTVGRGEIVSLLGRNGVGRSTTAKAIMGLVDCTGSVDFNGHDLTDKKAYQIAHLGLGYVPENRDIPDLNVEENLRLALKGRRTGRGRSTRVVCFRELHERAHTEAECSRWRATDADAGAYDDGAIPNWSSSTSPPRDWHR